MRMRREGRLRPGQHLRDCSEALSAVHSTTFTYMCYVHVIISNSGVQPTVDRFAPI